MVGRGGRSLHVHGCRAEKKAGSSPYKRPEGLQGALDLVRSATNLELLFSRMPLTSHVLYFAPGHIQTISTWLISCLTRRGLPSHLLFANPTTRGAPLLRIMLGTIVPNDSHPIALRAATVFTSGKNQTTSVLLTSTSALDCSIPFL